MQIHIRFFVFLFIFLWVFVGCSTNNESKQTENQIDTSAASESRSQIKAFWDIYRKAQKFRTEGKWREAVLNYEAALEINPEHEDSWFNLGNMYLELGQGKKAEVCWVNIIESNPNSARAHMQLGRLYLSFDRPETFDLDRAEIEFESAAKINKVITGPPVQLAYLALFRGDNNLAYNYLESVTVTDTKSVEPHFLLSYLSWKSDDIAKMQKHIERARELSTDNQVVKNDISEGDTKDGKSHLRPINQSVFYDYYQGIGRVNEENLSSEMIERFNNLDTYLLEIKKQIDN